MDMSLFSVMEDAPGRLVLENKGARLFSSIITLLMGATIAYLFRPGPPAEGNDLAAKAAPYFFGVLLLFSAFGAVDRQRIVFESGAVRFTRSLMPWQSFHRSISEIEKVDVRTETTTMYGEDSVKYRLYLMLRDTRPLEINRTHDGEFVRTLAARIEGFRK